jgi:hypothetical protein
VSFSAATVPDGAWELELGGRLLEDTAAATLFLKHGLTRRLELELGLEPVRQVSTGDGSTASLGDALVGLRHRFWEGRQRSLAWAALVKVPTAREPVGSGEWDATGLLVYSDATRRLSWDANLWISALGRESGSRLGQVLATFVTTLPGRGCWSPFIEMALQSTASEGDGGYVDAGALCSVSPRATLDMGAGAGWSDGFPDWTVDIGYTVRLGRAGR